MLKKISTFVEYITWLHQKSKEIQEQNCIFRIIDILNIKTNPLLQVQVINKSTVFNCLPSEIVCQDNLLEGFSKKDVRTITYLATENSHKPKYKIISKKLTQGLQSTIFKILNISSDKIEELSTNKLILRPAILKNMSKEDNYEIGFTNAIEQMIIEQDFLNNKNKI